MLEDAVLKLESLGCTGLDQDAWMLNFIGEKVENSIKSSCNVSTVPAELHQIAVDMVVGEFLLYRKTTGQLENFNLDAAVKQIQEGDTSITFAFGDGSSTPEKRLDALIMHLMTSGLGDLASYRCIKW